MDNWFDLQGNDVGEFIRAYRDALKAQRDSNEKLLNQKRRNAFSTLMSNANTKRQMYSNFPQRDKVKYDTETYMPALVKNQQSYQSGLDSLRKNALDLWNNIRYYQEQTDDYNAM